MSDPPAPDHQDAKFLRPGSRHYTAYVGPPDLYDIMGASQFRLLTTLGLREHHKLLDFGCGSLRLGRLLLPYLAPGNYHGVEPNAWLIEDAIAAELGREFVALRRPRFSHDDDFTIDGFGVKFDYIVAQSILSHCGRRETARLLAGFAGGLADDGIALATFVHVGSMGLTRENQDDGWVYPECVAYRPETVLRMVGEAGLSGVALPWFHPSQHWYALARRPRALPPATKFAHLSGALLRTPGFEASS